MCLDDRGGTSPQPVAAGLRGGDPHNMSADSPPLVVSAAARAHAVCATSSPPPGPSTAGLPPACWRVDLFIARAMLPGAALARNLIGGYAGLLALGHGVFFGVGAYAMAILSPHLGVGVGYWAFAGAIPIAIGTAIVFVPIARL